MNASSIPTLSDTPAPKVSIVVPAYGRTEWLHNAVLSLLRQELDEPFEVIVVDSSPDDNNERMIKSLVAPPACHLVCLRKSPEGPGPSRNMGFRHGRGAIIAFMDSDCQAQPEWLQAGLRGFAPGVGLVQGRTLPEPGARHSVFNRSLRVESESFLYETANIFYRREALEQAGGFPPDVNPVRFYGGEDVALAWTVKRAGWKTRFAHDALVHHVVFRVTPIQWLADKRLYICPKLVHDFPELRRFFFARYFFDRIQAAFSLGVVTAVAAMVITPWCLLGSLPYLWMRASEPTVAMRGARRIARALVYVPRDMVSFCILLAGSARFRALLI